MRDVLKAGSSYVEFCMRVLDLSALVLAGQLAALLRFDAAVSDIAPIHQ